ncbi:hypothetical protein [Streptomyces sp. 351MFTsu5.1]|uniref:hypothetical protein n=1 Tax=Streptomyces sp. 351MFTsu5.1 TaxID=1172180 RepID=UPI000374D5BA|nr:hypothetical protein [Streptomyces sp. 351MFTsu5.1]
MTTALELGPGEVLSGMLDTCGPGTGQALMSLAMYRDWRAIHRGAETAGARADGAG